MCIWTGLSPHSHAHKLPMCPARKVVIVENALPSECRDFFWLSLRIHECMCIHIQDSDFTCSINARMAGVSCATRFVCRRVSLQVFFSRMLMHLQQRHTVLFTHDTFSMLYVYDGCLFAGNYLTANGFDSLVSGQFQMSEQLQERPVSSQGFSISAEEVL